METENAILNAIVKISKATKDSKTINFNKSIYHRLAKPLTEKLNIGTEEAIFFSIIFKINYESDNSVDFKDLAGHLDCDTLEVLSKIQIIKNLLKKKLITVSMNNRLHRRLYGGDSTSYSVGRKVLELIISEQCLELTHYEIDNSIAFIRKISEIMVVYLDKDISSSDFIRELDDMFKEYPSIYFVEKINKISFYNETEKIFFLYLIYKAYQAETDISLNGALENIFWESRIESDHLKIKIIKGESVIEKKNLIEVGKSQWRNDAEVNVTESGMDYLFGEEACYFMIKEDKKEKNKYEILWKEIEEKPLFYNQEDLPTIDFMHDTLKEEKYEQITARLKEQNMPQGLAILLHGKPGTGKTETVYQVARVTERNIYKVEVSALKSMWFGESQRKIKQLFKDYYEYAEKQEKTPILLFNEADGVINKRKDSSSSGVAQTENEIQNILLQEMEDFKGILMATTNLIDNIDTAFDRRFLIKLELTVPNAFIRHQIIKHNIRHLNDNDCWILAEDFEFTGGVLQNIIRKSYMHEVLYNEQPNLDWYINLCKQENLHQKGTKTKVGFK
jgi:hypothetical protein